MKINDINEVLKNQIENRDINIINRFSNIIDSLNKEYVKLNDKTNTALIWQYGKIFQIQNSYLKGFKLLKEKKYYDGWCELEQCEINLNFLKLHYIPNANDLYKILFIQKHTKNYQSIFPYKLFLSPELIIREKKCSICNEIYSIRNNCGHETGKLYDGKMCHWVVTKMEPVAISFVTNPVQKYSVPFIKDSKTGETIDQYNYSTVDYVIKRLSSPFDAWYPEFTKKRHPHTKFKNIGRKDKCPCGSEKKYKNCCLLKDGVMMPHVIINFNVMPPEELQTVEYSY